jgi:hypothetical protein
MCGSVCTVRCPRTGFFLLSDGDHDADASAGVDNHDRHTMDAPAGSGMPLAPLRQSTIADLFSFAGATAAGTGRPARVSRME